MMKLNGRKVILWIMAVILCVTACGAASASTGDRVIYRTANGEEGYAEDWIEGAWKSGDYYFVVLSGQDQAILRYRDLQAEPEKFVLKYDYNSLLLAGIDMQAEEGTPAAPEQQAAAPAEEEEEDEDDDEDSFLVTPAGKEDGKAEEAEEDNEPTRYVYNWFARNGEMYGLAPRNKTDEAGRATVENIAILHAKLEDGKITLESSGLPDLESEQVVDSWDNNEYFNGMNRLVNTGDYLAGISYGSNGQKLAVFDLRDGSCRTVEFTGEVNAEVSLNADGTILVARGKWAQDYNTADIEFSRLNPEDLSEEPVGKLTGMKDSQVGACYDAEKNTLYYVNGGQLWAMPDMDQSKAEAVNECAESYPTAMVLPDGMILLTSNRTVMLRNPNPGERSGITLRVSDRCGSDAISEAVFEMGNDRGDVSVILQQDWGDSSDLLQSMMNRDGYTDVYFVRYDSNDFRALRKRGFVTDLAGNAQIAANVERMYPWAQEALKKDGKIIAVPVMSYTDSMNINLTEWKKAGGTEEELPKTWDQFLDWVESMPKRLEGKDVVLAEKYLNRTFFRSMIAQAIVSQYQVMMDYKGGDYSFNTPVLSGLLTRLANLDYEALGIPEEVNYDEDDGGESEWRDPLLNSYGYNGYNSSEEYYPLVLGFTEEDTPVLPMSLYVGFVNPFSEHPEEAAELLALVMKHEDIYTQYGLYTDKTEPVERSDADEQRKRVRDELEALKTALEKADSEHKAEIEERIRDTEKYMEDMERWMWMISREKVESYQKIQAYLKVQDYVLFDDLYGYDSDDPEEGKNERNKIIKGLFGYDEDEEEGGVKAGNVSIEEALDLIDQKIQMKRKEGN